MPSSLRCPAKKDTGKATLLLGRLSADEDIGLKVKVEDGVWKVESVEPHSPASRAGLKPNDTLRCWQLPVAESAECYYRYWCSESLDEIVKYFDDHDSECYIEIIMVHNG